MGGKPCRCATITVSGANSNTAILTSIRANVAENISVAAIVSGSPQMTSTATTRAIKLSGYPQPPIAYRSSLNLIYGTTFDRILLPTNDNRMNYSPESWTIERLLGNTAGAEVRDSSTGDLLFVPANIGRTVENNVFRVIYRDYNHDDYTLTINVPISDGSVRAPASSYPSPPITYASNLFFVTRTGSTIRENPYYRQ